MFSHTDRRALSAARARDRPRQHRGTTSAEALILDATERLLANVSLRELSVARIIREAGVSRATFYFYFSSKLSAFTALVARVTDEIHEAVKPLLEQRTEAASPAAALQPRLDAAMAVWSAHRPVLRAAVENWHAFEELRILWLSVAERSKAVLATTIERERAAGTAPHGADGRQLAATLAWAAERYLYVASLGVHDFLSDEKDAAEVVRHLWLGAIYAGGGAAGRGARA